jgi:olefin beta-lactone synthetase
MNLVSLLSERARSHPDRAALVDHFNGVDRVVSYGELARRVAAGAKTFEKLGLRPGDSILVFQPVSIELYEVLLAAFHLGLRVMLADPSAGRVFLSQCCRRLMPDAFVGSWKAQLLRYAVPELRRVERSICIGCWFPGTGRWRTDLVGANLVDVPEDAAALITFTSGSTGVPKAAVRTHGFLLAQHHALSKAMHFEECEVDLITLPVFVLANLASGLTSVLASGLANPGSPDTAAITGQCRRFSVTRCAASPAFFEALLADGIYDFQKIYTGGAPVFPDLLRKLSAALPDARIHSVYGSTEAEPIAHFEADDLGSEITGMTRSGGGLCAGVPVADLDLLIIRDQWGTALGPMDDAGLREMLVGPGVVGEIIVAGNHVLGGYLNGIGDEETKIHVGGQVWHRTGDAGWLDEKGRVWLLGRAAEKLESFSASGDLPTDALRYPFAIECALREVFPEIRMAALEWRNRRTLIVGRKCGDEVQISKIKALARGLGMKEVVWLDSIPLDRRHHAKIDYPALREMLRKQGQASTSL